MRAILLAALLASSVAAQTPDTTAARRRGPSAGLVLGGAAAGVTAVLLGNLALQAVGTSEDASGAALLLYPAGAVFGVYEIGRSRGRHGTLGGTIRGGVRGTLFSAGGALLLGYGVGNLLDETDGNAAVALVGLTLMLVAPPYGAAVGYTASDVQPVVLVGPDGDRAPGLALRVAL